MFPDSSLKNYSITDTHIGEGSFGVVMKGKCIKTGRTVALKKIRIKKGDINSSFPIKAFREMKTLQSCDHKNVVKLYDNFALGSSLVLVMEHCDTDLGTLLRYSRKPLKESHIKSFLQQLLRGLAYVHENKMIHRDIKPYNLLINKRGELKIADFGLATLYVGDKKTYSHKVASRWYRAPELLYGSQNYTSSVDIYSVGMVFGEMLNNSHLIPGESDIDQLTKVIKVFGLPNEKVWPGVTKLPDFNKIDFPKIPPMKMTDLLKNASSLAIDLFNKLVIYDPKKRITAKEALKHEYFFTKPFPKIFTKLMKHSLKKGDIFDKESVKIKNYNFLKDF